MFQSSKDEIALILFGTPGTENELWDGSSDEYRHVTVARSFAIVDWELLDYVQNKISISNISGDILDGIAVAINHFTKDQNKKWL
ncbi:unnamed protein product [Brachionus calyciflorus]|uniref:Ku70/Ku80 N-terminal alpha/beta domain-containing protein n=1 Tax=Brachionus calyciflorus TaxID=104777 RepID=A0A814KSH0_9BILA|nr:unnamed protein product [Brachionus calyciflorus]